MTAPARTKSHVSRAGNGESDSKTKPRKRGASRARSAAADRAYARREERRAQRETSGRPAKQRTNTTQRSNPGRQPRPVRAKAKQPQPKKQPQTKATASRVPLVVSSMSILGVGLVATLWLSIANVSGSYELQQQELKIESLNAEKENLVLHNSSQSSTPALQRRAFREGLGPGSQPAYLVRHPDGSTTLVGEPTPAPEAPPARGDQQGQQGEQGQQGDPRQGGSPDSGPPAEAR